MRRDADEEMGRVVGLMPETQSRVEDYVAKAKTLKTGAPTPQIVEVARQPPTEAEPCSPETQDEAESLITVEDFDIPALREDAENPEEKIGILRATSVAETFPKRRVQTAPREVEQNGVWRRDRNELAAKVFSTFLFATDGKRRARRNRKSSLFARVSDGGASASINAASSGQMRKNLLFFLKNRS